MEIVGAIEFKNYLNEKSSRYNNIVFDNFSLHKWSKKLYYDQGFIDLFMDRSSVDDLVVKFEKLFESDKVSLFSVIVRVLVFGDGNNIKMFVENTENKQIISKLMLFITRTKRFGFSFMREFSTNLCEFLGIFCGEFNFQNIFLEPDFFEIFDCAIRCFPYVYENCNSLSNIYFKGERPKIMPNDLEILGMSINYVIISSKDFILTRDDFLKSHSKIIFNEEQNIDELKKKLEKKTDDFNYILKKAREIENRHKEWISSKNQYEENIKNLLFEKNKLIQQLTEENERLKKNNETILSFISNRST